MQSDSPLEDMVSVREAARRLGRSEEQVRRYLRAGLLDGRRIGGQWFIDAATLRVPAAADATEAEVAPNPEGSNPAAPEAHQPEQRTDALAAIREIRQAVAKRKGRVMDLDLLLAESRPGGA